MTGPKGRSMRDLVLDGLLRSAPMSVFAYDASGRCVFSEGAALGQFRLRPGELVGQNLFELYADQAEVVDRMKRALDGDTFRETDTIGGHTYDTWYLPLPGDSSAPMAVGITVDATDRASAEAAEELYRAFAEAAPQFIALAAVDGRVLFVNPGGRRLAGIPDDVDVTTTSITDYLTPEGLEASIQVEQPAVIRDGRWSGETTLRHWPTGEGIPVEVSSFLVTHPETGEPMALATVQSDLREVVAGRDAVQRQVAYQRGLLHHLHEAQEAERQRIAADIHDDTVQVMAAVNLRLQSLRRAVEPELPADRRAELAALDSAVRDATNRLRRLLVELDLPTVDDGDVRAALEKAAESSRIAGGPVTTVEVSVETEPSPVVARTLVRIAHEALTNVRKHAQEATRAGIALRQEAGQYVLSVHDDGPGLPAGARAPDRVHRGVRGMTERAESVGGTLTLADRAGGGVLVEARLPHLLGHPGQQSGLPDSRIFLEQVMETISECYCAIDSQWRYVYMNRAGYRLLNRDPADSVVGGVIWDEFDIAPEFAAAYHRARDEHVEVEITGYHEEWDVWIYNRIVPTAGGLSIFARDVSDEMRKAAAASRHERQRLAARALSHAIAAGGDDVAGLTRAAAAIVESWPLRGLRVSWPGGSVDAGTLAGPVRRVPLVVGDVEVGAAEVVGEGDDEVDPDLWLLLAVRLSAVTSGT